MHVASSLVLGSQCSHALPPLPSQVRPTTIPVKPFPPPDPVITTVLSRFMPKLAGRRTPQ